MNDFVELLRFLTGTGAAVIPWLAVGGVIWLFITFSPDVKTWLKAKADCEKQRVARAAEQNEILRNNNAVIENCTQTMKMIENYSKSQNKDLLAAMDNHENLSAERIAHIQTVLNKNAAEIVKVRGDVAILLDRD